MFFEDLIPQSLDTSAPNSKKISDLYWTIENSEKHFWIMVSLTSCYGVSEKFLLPIFNWSLYLMLLNTKVATPFSAPILRDQFSCSNSYLKMFLEVWCVFNSPGSS